MILKRIASLDSEDAPLEMVDLPVPVPAANEVLVRVLACGVCHTELDEIEGRTAPPRYPVVPGHEIVGVIEEVGAEVPTRRVGERVGVGWIHHSDGSGEENLSPAFRATGRDVNGGSAEYMTVPAGYAFPIPGVFSDAEAAPLLCAGAVGYRALRLTQLKNGERLGLMGFGGSAHIVLQLVRHLYPDSPVSVHARDAQARLYAMDLGADWAGDTGDPPPEKSAAVIDTTPVWGPVLCALETLRPGGRLVVNAIRKEDQDKEALQGLSYRRHLWLEKEIKTVANVTGRDIAEFLPLAAEIPIRPEVTAYPLDQANRALVELKRHPVRGAKVLVMSGGGNRGEGRKP
ncbi:MAG TPA: alcohol dehydrogenase catalytic domain-containing protein [Desulfurivibrionaceae bacterium]|nr:alcohol dehydrogenase catalytic domain-containing protein [Desulfurivibrionaceae bacterium]